MNQASLQSKISDFYGFSDLLLDTLCMMTNYNQITLERKWQFDYNDLTPCHILLTEHIFECALPMRTYDLPAYDY